MAGDTPDFIPQNQSPSVPDFIPAASAAPVPQPQPQTPPPTTVAKSSPDFIPISEPTDEATQPITQNDHNLLSSFKDQILKPAEAMVSGPGTMLSKDNAGPTFEDWVKNPAAQNWQRTKDAFHKTMNSSLIVPSNAITPEEAAANPHLAAAEKGVSNAIRGLTTPGSIALIAGTEGMGELPAALERTLGASKELAPYAAKAAKVAKYGLTALGAYFTKGQIEALAKQAPEAIQAALTGQTDKAIELGTSAIINGVVGYHAGKETIRGINDIRGAAAETSAMKHKDFADTVHEDQAIRQIGGGTKDLIANLGQEVAPSLKDREADTDYIEANRDKKLLAKRQEETKVGPKPADQIAAVTQGQELPLKPEETAPESEPLTQKELTDPASQEALALKAAVEDAKAASAAHVITPEERAAMVDQQDPTRERTAAHEKALDYVKDQMEKTKEAAQKLGLLPKGQLRDNFVPHEYDFDDTSDPTRRRLYNTYHDAQQAGLVGKNKDFFALTSDYIGKMSQKIADATTINNLKSHRTNDGAPLAVSGGFVEGQRVSTEGAQPPVLSTQDVQRLTKNGQLPKLIKSGDVLADPTGKVFRYNPDHYEKAVNLFESHPIGPTPIPPKVLDHLKPQIDEMIQRGLLYKNEKGEYFNTEPVYARTPVYLHKDIAKHFNDAVKPKTEESTSFFGNRGPGYDLHQFGKDYDYLTSNAKSMELWGSPFHRVTEGMLDMEGMGIIPGGKLAGQTNLKLAPRIDYGNLSPEDYAAIRDGIVTSDPRGRSMSNVEEGLGAGGQNTWGAKSYRLFDKTLEKLGVPQNIRDKVNLQKIMTDDIFGPQGSITNAKFGMYKQKKPLIADQMRKEHPDWPDYEIQKYAGRRAAEIANDKFGGLNHVILGRSLETAKWMRRLMLAPDFLESRGRSILDLVHPYGADLAAKFIQFNTIAALTAAGINYAIHHDPNDDSVKGRVDATHLLDHPFGVVSPDNKSVYGLRLTSSDFLHLINKPREFVSDRANPGLRAIDEIAEQRNQYGRKESLPEALKIIPKSIIPIQLQTPLGFGPNTTTEPSAKDQLLRSIGIQARPNRSNAEQLAIDKVSTKLQGQEARTGDALVRQQLKFNAEDKLRAAYAMQDPDKKAKAVDDAKHDVDNLAQRKIINPEEKKKIMTDAKGSRLKSIFNSLTPDDALDVWDAATDDEKKELGVAMNSKYLRWRENLAKNGQKIDSLNVDDQNMLNRFKEASGQLAEIRERPEPAQTQKPKTQEKSSPGLNSAHEPDFIPAEQEAPDFIPHVTGLIKPGNIDVNHRPIIWNDDGTPSTIFSATIPIADGKWALIPTIANGKFLTPSGKIPKETDRKAMDALEDAATEQYKKTGEHLGIFDSQKDADDYANKTHAWMPDGSNRQVYTPSYRGESNMPLTRKEYEQALASASRDYSSLIEGASKRYDVPSDLIQAMIKQESLGDPNAVSRKGAQGLLQLEPITAKHYGVTNPNDPGQNIDAGVHYMADLLKIYNGDEAKALAAFNAGPTAVNHYGGVPPFHETQKYVEAIQNR